MKGQISVELLALAGFVLAIFLPLIFFSYVKSDELRKTGESIYSSALVERLASLSSSIYYAGEGAKIRAVIFVPPSIEKIEFKEQGDATEIVGTIRDGNQIVAVAAGRIVANDLVPGSYTLEIENKGDYVEITVS